MTHDIEASNKTTEEDAPFKLNLKTDCNTVMQNKRDTLGLLNLVADQQFGLGGKIV